MLDDKSTWSGRPRSIAAWTASDFAIPRHLNRLRCERACGSQRAKTFSIGHKARLGERDAAVRLGQRR